MTTRYEEVTFQIGTLLKEKEKIEKIDKLERTQEEWNYFNYLENEIKDLRREQSFIRSKGGANE